MSDIKRVNSLFRKYGLFDSLQYKETSLGGYWKKVTYEVPGVIRGYWTHNSCAASYGVTTFYYHPKCSVYHELNLDGLLYFIERDIKETTGLRKRDETKTLKKKLRKANKENKKLLEDCVEAKEEVVLLLEQNKLLQKILELSGIQV